jgi:hypothetical protein
VSPVYVDDARIHYKHNMLMSHMIADTTAELHSMALLIGLHHEWCQHEGTYREHYDVCANKRKEAIKHGAYPITRLQLGLMLMQRRQTQK